MNRFKGIVVWCLFLTIASSLLLPGCKSPAPTSNTTTTPVITTTGATTTTGMTTTSAVAYSLPQLEYLLLDKYPDFFWCDPDYYPVARTGQEQQNAIDRFPSIQANQAEFNAILQRLNLPVKTDYTDTEKLLIYREYKKLTYGVQMTVADNGFNFDLRVGTGQGQRIIGSINNLGTIIETSREASVNTCPICLVKGTLIATPSGDIPVEQLNKGMNVWTLDADGNRISAMLVKVASTPVPLFFRALRLELSDGRMVTASPWHPTAAGKNLADYQVGDMLDGAQVVKTELVTYDSADTYDILPAGPTGFYWANGVLLRSTLTNK